MIAAVLICLYLVAWVDGKPSKRLTDSKKVDSNIAADAAKGIKLFDSGRFREALSVFSRCERTSIKNVYLNLFTSRSIACFVIESRSKDVDAVSMLREDPNLLAAFLPNGSALTC
jgi:hypothetical protein